jgi:hypothetical protein
LKLLKWQIVRAGRSSIEKTHRSTKLPTFEDISFDQLRDDRRYRNLNIPTLAEDRGIHWHVLPVCGELLSLGEKSAIRHTQVPRRPACPFLDSKLRCNRARPCDLDFPVARVNISGSPAKIVVCR